MNKEQIKKAICEMIDYGQFVGLLQGKIKEEKLEKPFFVPEMGETYYNKARDFRWDNDERLKNVKTHEVCTPKMAGDYAK